MSSNNAAESEAFIGASKQKPGKMAALKNFCYDSDTGTCMGRTGKSWAQILGFYVIFYACLAGFFAICLSVFMTTVDSTKPRWYGKGSIMGDRPGLGFQPWLIDDPDSTMIKFTPDDPKSYEKYVSRLRSFLKPYMDANEKETEKCKVEDKDSPRDKPCSYKETIIEALKAYGVQCIAKEENSDPIKYEKPDACIWENLMSNDKETYEKELDKVDFGFSQGKPIVLLTLNRMLDFRPTPFAKDDEELKDLSTTLRGDIVDANTAAETDDDGPGVFLNCEGQFAADKDFIGPVDLKPKNGLPFAFFPYRKYELAEYDQPVALMQFKKPPKGTIVLVECKAWAKNVIHDRQNKLGLAHFEILREFEKGDKEE